MTLENLITKRDLIGLTKYLSNGGDINGSLCSDEHPLFYAIDCAVENQHLAGKENFTANMDDEITLRLIRAGADVHARDSDGLTPLMYALSMLRGYKMVRELINAGSDINAKCNRNITPLMYALKQGYHMTLIEKFLRMGASVHDRDSDLQTPLYYAVNHVNGFEIVSLLIKYGADVCVRRKDGANVLASIDCKTCAYSWGYCGEEFCKMIKRVVNLLLASGLKLKKEDGGSVIHGTNCNYVIDLYVRKGTSIESRDSYGRTPLMCAVYRNKFKKVESLLFLFNADLNSLNDGHSTALHDCFLMRPDVDIITWFLYFGADIYARDQGNQTALDYVLERGDWDEGRSYKLCVHIVIKHVVLFDDGKELNDSFRNYQNEDKRKLYCSLVEHCKMEVRKMKITFLNDYLTFYQFCCLRKFYKNEFLDISVDEYLYNFKQIKYLFPIYHDMIITRMKDNQKEYYRRVLSNRLEYVIIKPGTAVENQMDSDVRLVFDCTQLIAQHLSKKDIYRLFLASFAS